MAKSAPDPIPVVLLGRLAVDHREQGQGIGPGLLKDALRRAYEGAEIIGGRAILVHASDEEAASFYRKYGIEQCLGLSLQLDVADEGCAPHSRALIRPRQIRRFRFLESRSIQIAISAPSFGIGSCGRPGCHRFRCTARVLDKRRAGDCGSGTLCRWQSRTQASSPSRPN